MSIIPEASDHLNNLCQASLSFIARILWVDLSSDNDSVENSEGGIVNSNLYVLLDILYSSRIFDLYIY